MRRLAAAALKPAGLTGMLLVEVQQNWEISFMGNLYHLAAMLPYN